MRAAIAFVALLAVSCGSPSLKATGEHCVSSSECDPGLLCDLAQTSPICAGSGVTPAELDAPPIDGHPLIDSGGNHPDAAQPDAGSGSGSGSGSGV